MSDLNLVALGGRLVNDPDVRHTNNNTSVMNFRLCSNRVYTRNNERVEEPVFVDVVVWGKQAESLSKVLTKGRFVTVSGRLRQESWEDKDGNRRSRLSVVAADIGLGPKPSNAKQEAASTNTDDVPF